MALNWPSSPTLVDIIYWLNCLSNFCSLIIWLTWPIDSLSLWAVRPIFPQLGVQRGLSAAREATQHESTVQLVLSLSLCSIADHRALIPSFFLIISQDGTSSGSRALFFGFYMSWLQHSVHCHNPDFLAPLTLLYSITSQTCHCHQSLWRTCSVCLFPSIVPACTRLGSDLKLQPLPDGWDEVPGFRWSGSSALSDLYDTLRKALSKCTVDHKDI